MPKECGSAVSEARRLFRIASRRKFSCWFFQIGAIAEFEEHLDLIGEVPRTGAPIPKVVRKRFPTDQTPQKNTSWHVIVIPSQDQDWSGGARGERTETSALDGKQNNEATLIGGIELVSSFSVLAKTSARAPLAKALLYVVTLKPSLLAYTRNERLEIDNSILENALRGIAVGRKAR